MKDRVGMEELRGRSEIGFKVVLPDEEDNEKCDACEEHSYYICDSINNSGKRICVVTYMVSSTHEALFDHHSARKISEPTLLCQGMRLASRLSCLFR